MAKKRQSFDNDPLIRPIQDAIATVKARATREGAEQPRKQKLRKGGGTIYKYPHSRNWWIAFTVNGKRYYQSSGSERKGDAQDLLATKLGEGQQGIVVTSKINTITVAAALKHHVDNLKMNGHQIDNVQRRIDKHIVKSLDTTPETDFHPGRALSSISTDDLTAYASHRLAQKAAPASINRELAILRRSFRLAARAKKITAVPHVPMLHEHNTRTGFFERHEFDAVLKHLPSHLHAPLTFAFLTGWRFKSEVLPLTIDRVDLTAGVVTLAVGSTKNREGRSFHLTAELRTVLTAQLGSLDALKAKNTISPFVFHYADGRRIRDCRKAWRTACTAAGYPNRIFHDFRRSAVRTLERAAVPRSVAMQMVGHKTESIYRRYAIVDAAMLQEAAAKLDEYAVVQAQQAKAAKRRGQVRAFKR